MKALAKVTVFYRTTLPEELLSFVEENNMCSIVKGGVCTFAEVNMICATVVVKSNDKKIDVTNNPKVIIKNLDLLLKSLVKRNLLVNFT